MKFRVDRTQGAGNLLGCVGCLVFGPLLVLVLLITWALQSDAVIIQAIGATLMVMALAALLKFWTFFRRIFRPFKYVMKLTPMGLFIQDRSFIMALKWDGVASVELFPLKPVGSAPPGLRKDVCWLVACFKTREGQEMRVHTRLRGFFWSAPDPQHRPFLTSLDPEHFRPDAAGPWINQTDFTLILNELERHEVPVVVAHFR